MVVRSAAWTNIMMKVNSVGVARRTVPELKKKWSDIKKKVKAKMAAISRYARQTGGGPSCPEKLSQLEEKVGSTCRREQVEGFGLADACMQALTTRENIMSERNEEISPEEPAVEAIDQPHCHGDDPATENTSGPVNPPRPNEELFLPADLGLSESQTTYINEYTNQHLQYMQRVDSRFDTLEKGLNNLAEAFLRGSNSISQGLNTIASLLESQTGGVTQIAHSPTTTIPQSVDNPPPGDQVHHDIQGSPSSLSTEHSLGSAITLKSNVAESVSSSESVLLDEESSSAQALDLSLSNPSLSNWIGNQTTKVCAGDQMSSGAHFLLTCKKELSSPENRQSTSATMTPTIGTRKTLGTSWKVNPDFRK
ncbi:uncharacterized protein LOC130366752 [Hyla sarda]|uniref:uncharacterized protein LOC130366752 n=1 Tax=Hyla sarda TaxID=327740 RepID=UPI0024C39123|nr:uncharacterized protein LOC130366752 [Hyla sarda]